MELLEKYKDQIQLCSFCRCLMCREGCPIWLETRLESACARGRLFSALAILDGEIKMSNATAERFYQCTLCGYCEKFCAVNLGMEDLGLQETKIYTTEITMSLRNLVIEEGRPPVQIQNVLENIERFGNPLGAPPGELSAFTKGLDFNIKNAVEEKCDILLYLGSIAPSNERNQRTIQALIRVLTAANVDFGILCNEEIESGGLVRELGEMGLFEELAQRNAELFQKYGINRIVCLSPHDYYAFVNYYPDAIEGGLTGIKVQHYTEFLSDLIRNGELKVRGNLRRTVSFHDPCYLGRKSSGIYDQPRELVRATGAKLVEMRLTRENSYCCGGGGGLLWYEPKDKPKVENQRAKQALETGADVLLVACPQCAQMLEDGVKAVEGTMKVMDLAELMEESI